MTMKTFTEFVTEADDQRKTADSRITPSQPDPAWLARVAALAARKEEEIRQRAVRLAIKPTTYRDRPGFLVYGSTGHVFPTKIFTRTRAAAERIKAADRNANIDHLLD